MIEAAILRSQWAEEERREASRRIHLSGCVEYRDPKKLAYETAPPGCKAKARREWQIAKMRELA